MAEALTVHNILSSTLDVLIFTAIALVMNRKKISIDTVYMTLAISLVNVVGYCSGSILIRQSLLLATMSICILVGFKVEDVPSENIPRTIAVTAILWYVLQILTMITLDAAGENIFVIKPYRIYPAFQIVSVLVFVANYFIVSRRGGFK